jgi:hypothetical protein
MQADGHVFQKPLESIVTKLSPNAGPGERSQGIYIKSGPAGTKLHVPALLACPAFELSR